MWLNVYKSTVTVDRWHGRCNTHSSVHWLQIASFQDIKAIPHLMPSPIATANHKVGCRPSLTGKRPTASWPWPDAGAAHAASAADADYHFMWRNRDYFSLWRNVQQHVGYINMYASYTIYCLNALVSCIIVLSRVCCLTGPTEDYISNASTFISKKNPFLVVDRHNSWRTILAWCTIIYGEVGDLGTTGDNPHVVTSS